MIEEAIREIVEALMRDCVFLAIAFGSKPGDPNWNEHADINGDQIVDIYDMVIVASVSGKHIKTNPTTLFFRN